MGGVPSVRAGRQIRSPISSHYEERQVWTRGGYQLFYLKLGGHGGGKTVADQARPKTSVSCAKSSSPYSDRHAADCLFAAFSLINLLRRIH